MQRSGKCVWGLGLVFLQKKKKLSQVLVQFQSKYGNIIHITPCSLSPMVFPLNHVIVLRPDFVQSFFRSK